jgi:hypothetical protein
MVALGLGNEGLEGRITINDLIVILVPGPAGVL